MTCHLGLRASSVVPGRGEQNSGLRGTATAGPEAQAKGTEGGLWISESLLFYFFTIVLIGSAVGLSYATWRGQLLGSAGFSYGVILLLSLVMLHHFRRRRREPLGKDFNL